MTKADSYNFKEIRAAVARQFALLAPEDLRPGMKVLLKPNLIMRAKPERAVTTHPALVEAVVCQLLEMGVTNITLADSPGGLYTAPLLEASYELTGYTELAHRRGVTLNTSTGSRMVRREENLLCKEFEMISPVLDADYVINLCKAKTHCMMTLSGAVKNSFGCIPGLLKPELHYRFPDPDRFARMLVDLALTVKPSLSLVDAVDGMEGDGPTGGTPCHLGLIAGAKGDSLFALDLVLCRLMGIPPDQVPTVGESIARGLCPERWTQVPLVGDVGAVDLPKAFTLPASRNALNFSNNVPRLLQPLVPLLQPLLSARPHVRERSCVGCGRCAESCPIHTITVGHGKARIGLDQCIRCYCCHEMCPVRAIDIKSPWFFRF